MARSAQPPPSLESGSGSDSGRISELADKLADRILVTDRSASTDSEVRIKLNESVLQGAEITLRRDQGEIVIQMTVANGDLREQLQPHTGNLQYSLEKRLDAPVRIQVNVQTDAGDSSGDGRSRNRRDLRDEWGQDV